VDEVAAIYESGRGLGGAGTIRARRRLPLRIAAFTDGTAVTSARHGSANGPCIYAAAEAGAESARAIVGQLGRLLLAS
jgi:hypothetical protein